METKRIAIYILVFVASLVVALIFSYIFYKIAYAREKIRDMSAGGKGVASPFRTTRFITPEAFINLSVACAILAATAVILLFVSLNWFDLYVMTPSALLIGYLAYHAPRAWLTRKIKAWNFEVEQKVQDLTIGLAGGLRAGMALPQALEVVSKNIGGAMEVELGETLSEYHLGLELSEAFERFEKRINCDDLSLLCTSIKLTGRSGGSLADVLDRMTETIRARTDFKEKLRTMTAQGRLEAVAISSAPVVAMIILYALDPKLMTPLFTTPTGWVALTIVAIMETIGFLCINKIITIEP